MVTKPHPEREREKIVITRTRTNESGLTLVELLVVLLIIGLIAAFAVPRLVGYVSKAKTEAATIQISRLDGILELYRLDLGRYPSTDEGLQALVEPPAGTEKWNGPYIKNADSLIDPWGRAYGYQHPGQHGDYDLYTLGADGTEGGEGENADVANW